MDLDPAAVQAAACALASTNSLPKWMQIPALGRDMTPIAEIAVAAAQPIIAAEVERATKDAIADRVEAHAKAIDGEYSEHRTGTRSGLYDASLIARSFTSAPTEET